MKKQLALLIATLFLLTGLVGCNGKKKEEKTTADSSSPTEPTGDMTPDTAPKATPEVKKEIKKEAAPAPKKEVKELTIKGSDLETDAKSGKYKYCTNCRRRASKYHYYYFDKAEYEKVVGAENLKKTVTVQVEIVSKNDTNYKPKNPNAPQPHGGFTHNHYTCKVLKLIPAK